jgi:hypothetical protein
MPPLSAASRRAEGAARRIPPLAWGVSTGGAFARGANSRGSRECARPSVAAADASAAKQSGAGRKRCVVAGGVDDGPNGADDDVRLPFFRYLDEVVTVHGHDV